MDTLISARAIHRKVRSMGKEITHYYRNLHPFSNENPLHLVALLKGSVIFFADLIRRIDIPLHIHFLEVSSYGMGTTSSGKVTIKSELSFPISNSHLLIVEDIIDSGLTLNVVYDRFLDMGAASVEIAALLYKKEKSQLRYPARFPGFIIPDEFVVGYGLDYQNLYRNLPYIGIMRP